MEKHKEYELSGIFGVKLVAKNILLGSPDPFYAYKVKTQCVFINKNSVFADWTKWKRNIYQWKYDA